MLRAITILSLVLMLVSCKWKTDEKPWKGKGIAGNLIVE